MSDTAAIDPQLMRDTSTPAPVRPPRLQKPSNGFLFFLTILLILCITYVCCAILREFGLEAMLILFIAISGAIWGWVIRWLYQDQRLTLSHILVIWMVWTGTILGGASYYLSYKGLTANLETLSRYIMVEVVAGVGGYFVKSGFENITRLRHPSDTTFTTNPADESSTDVEDDVVTDL